MDILDRFEGLKTGLYPMESFLLSSNRIVKILSVEREGDGKNWVWEWDMEEFEKKSFEQRQKLMLSIVYFLQSSVCPGNVCHFHRFLRRGCQQRDLVQ